MLILGDSTFAKLANMYSRIFIALKKSYSVKCNLVAETGEEGKRSRCHGGDQRHVD
jgi:hypothetical protein